LRALFQTVLLVLGVDAGKQRNGGLLDEALGVAELELDEGLDVC